MERIKIHKKEFDLYSYKRLLIRTAEVYESSCRSKQDNTNNIEIIKEQLLDGSIILGTPILINFDNDYPMGACTVISVPVDIDYERLRKYISQYATLGLGFGVSLDNVHNPIKFIKTLNEILCEIDFNCDRNVAAIATMSINNDYIDEFISLKRNENFEKWKINLSVLISDDYMLKNYNSSLIKSISESMWYCGEPGIIFWDKFQRDNPIKDSKYECLAPCAEIAMSSGEMCHFGYINLMRFIEDKTIKYDNIALASKNLLRLLDGLLDVSLTRGCISNTEAKNKRRVGIGVCGFSEMLMVLGIPYDSKEAAEIIEDITAIINYHSKCESVNLSIEKGPFLYYDNSEYPYDWILKYAEKATNHITTEMWKELNDLIKQNGIRNSTTVAFPPTGNSAFINNVSNSIEPIFSLQDFVLIQDELEQALIQSQHSGKFIGFVKTLDKCGDISEIATGLRKRFEVASEISPSAHIKILQAAQRFNDEAISKTINLYNGCTSDDVVDIILSCFTKDIKGVTVFRENCLSERVC